MPASLQITYAGYNFHDEGVPHYGTSIQPEGGNSPTKLLQSFAVRMRFFETSFADNEARWTRLKDVLLANPRGLLVIADENGNVLESGTVRFAGHDGDPEWGQFRREVKVTFDTTESLGINSAFSASFTPRGGQAVQLPNVTQWQGQTKVERPTTHAAIRREGMENISATGKWSPAASLTDAQKRDALIAKKAAIQAIANCPDGTLAYGTFSGTMQVENVTADIGDSIEGLTWTLTAFRRIFPDGTYAEMDYTVDVNDEREESRTTVTVSGKVVADTESHARSAAEAVRASYATGRTYLSGQTTKRVLDGTDGTDPCVELNFSYRFRESLDVVSWKLKVATGTDTRTGDITTTYSGSVVALTSAPALAKARALGGGAETSTLLLMSKSEDVDSFGVGTDDTGTFTSVSFSYTYLGKSGIAFAEVQTDGTYDHFSANTISVSGSVTADTKADALTFARTFKLTGVLMFSEREADSTITKAITGGNAEHFSKVDFGYTYGRTMTDVTIGYARQVAHDYNERLTTISFQGVAYGPAITDCDTFIDTIAAVSGSGVRKVKDERSDDWKIEKADSGPDTSLFMQRPFQISWVMPITAADAGGDEIIEAAYTINTKFGIWKTVIDEIPYGLPYVQENVARTCGTVTVSGSITAVQYNTALTWARDKKQYATGYQEEPDETHGFVFLPRNGTTVKHHVVGFTYASRDPDKWWGGTSAP